MTIGTKITEARKRKGLSQEQLADEAGISLRTLQRIEKAETQPHGHTLKSICAALDLDIENLMDYGKKESTADLIVLHLGPLGELVIPFGGVILPLIFWLNKKNRVVEADRHGKNILNFQIIYTVVSNVIFFAGVVGKLMHYYVATPYFYTYFGILVASKAYAIYAAATISKDPEKLFYPNLIRFVK